MDLKRPCSVICLEHIGHIADGHKGLGINLVNKIFHPGDLKSVHNKINNGFVGIGVTACSGDFCCAALEGFYKSVADFLGLICDNDDLF